MHSFLYTRANCTEPVNEHADGMKELVKVSDAYDKALKGFDLQVGISLIF